LSTSSSSGILGDLCGDFDPDLEVEHYGKMKKQFCDERDGKKYVYVQIGSQIWMAENLNYNAVGSLCHGDNTGGDSQNRCDTYGRLYDWQTSLAVCPAGWHLPGKDEWEDLVDFIGSDVAGKKLKAEESGWIYDVTHFGTDDYGFSALPSSHGYYDIGFDVLRGGYWWVTLEYDSSNAWRGGVGSYSSKVDFTYCGKSYKFSVRCIKG